MDPKTLTYILQALAIAEQLIQQTPNAVALVQRVQGILNDIASGKLDTAPTDADWKLLDDHVAADLDQLKADSNAPSNPGQG